MILWFNQIKLKHVWPGIIGILTAPLRPLPNTVIIGVQKGGTTSLFSYLEQHPEVSRSYRKEVRFFSSGRRHMGSMFYRHYFPIRRKKIIMEATPGYVFKVDSLRRMKRMLPDAKLILVLRDPVERAYSAYNMKKRGGYEKRSFLDACLDDLGVDGRNDTGGTNRGYMRRGFYYRQIKNLLEIYPKENLHIMLTDNLRDDLGNELNRMCSFLNINPIDWKITKRLNRGNYEPLDKEVKIRLSKFFEEDQQELKKFISENHLSDQDSN